MIPVSVPLVFPKVVPSNWETWNKVWEENKNYVPKVYSTTNSGAVSWIGFDIYVKDGIDASNIIKYRCKNVNCPELFPSLFDNLDKLPIDIQVVRVLQSLSRVPSHQDFAVESGYHSVRSVLSDNNIKQTWWYEFSDASKHYLTLPEETNTWWYDDAKVKHGTDFYPGFNKQLIMYRGTIKTESITSMIGAGIKQYPTHVVYI
jgi:hypothetical protein